MREPGIKTTVQRGSSRRRRGGLSAPIAVMPAVQSFYRRPGGVDTYRRPGGVDTYKRP